MPTAPEKFIKELGWLRAFQEKCSECPRTDPTQPAPPAPDIIFAEVGLGIEITEYSMGQGKTGSRARQFENVHQRIVRAAQIEFEQRSTIRIQVSVHWTNFGECPRLSEEKAVAHGIARHVTTNTTTRIGGRFVDWGPSNDPLLEKYRVEVNVFPIDGAGASCWSSGACFCFPDEAVRIQTTLKEKEPKISDYRKYCENLWLLIIAHRDFLSSQFSPNPTLLQQTFASSFDRVFILDETRSSVFEIKTAPNAVPVN